METDDRTYWVWSPNDGHGWRACFHQHDDRNGAFEERATAASAMSAARFPLEVFAAFVAALPRSIRDGGRIVPQVPAD